MSDGESWEMRYHRVNAELGWVQTEVLNLRDRLDRQALTWATAVAEEEDRAEKYRAERDRARDLAADLEAQLTSCEQLLP
jgi:hypothetical protein